MPGPGVDYEQLKLAQQAMNATVLQRAKEHPGKPMKAWKLFLIIGSILAVMIIFFVLLLTGVLDGIFGT
ncbi:MAG: hypothetical protein IKR51_05220 [Oscillospiraceae bacterium]|nr:hypothetical protein [Oscillospiraceae bacterium]